MLLPYDSRDQATSGVLVEAVAAGVPVVATGFPHAVELLGGGAGLIAQHDDPESMAAAIRTIVETEETAKQMHEAALRDAHDSSWPAVGEQLPRARGPDRRGARRVTMPGSPPSYAHLVALMDEHGIFEHALFDVPRRGDGYCVDDVARALIVLVREPDQTPELGALAETCLAFLEDAVEADGRVHNRMAAGGGWTDDPALGDWWGRALWALGVDGRPRTDPGRALARGERVPPCRIRQIAARTGDGVRARSVPLTCWPRIRTTSSRTHCCSTGCRRSRSRETTPGPGRNPASATPMRCSPKPCWPPGWRWTTLVS